MRYLLVAVLMLRENEMIHERRGFYMDKIVDFKTTCNDLDVEFEVMSEILEWG